MTYPAFPLRRSVALVPPAVHAAPVERPAADCVIRPAAVIPEASAREVLAWLKSHSIEQGGVWSEGSSTGIWQRYDRPWNGEYSSRGTSQLVGTIYVTYDAPRRYEVLIHRVQITDHGLMLGWTTNPLVDEILAYVDLSLATCPREDALPTGYASDPFKRVDAYSRALSSR